MTFALKIVDFFHLHALDPCIIRIIIIRTLDRFSGVNCRAVILTLRLQERSKLKKLFFFFHLFNNVKLSYSPKSSTSRVNSPEIIKTYKTDVGRDSHSTTLLLLLDNNLVQNDTMTLHSNSVNTDYLHDFAVFTNNLLFKCLAACSGGKRFSDTLKSFHNVKYYREIFVEKSLLCFKRLWFIRQRQNTNYTGSRG